MYNIVITLKTITVSISSFFINFNGIHVLNLFICTFFLTPGDLAVQMNNFLKCGTFDENGKLACVLKCVQQEIICPAVMDLRLGVYPKFPYKDIKVKFCYLIFFFGNFLISHFFELYF